MKNYIEISLELYRNIYCYFNASNDGGMKSKRIARDELSATTED